MLGDEYECRGGRKFEFEPVLPPVLTSHLFGACLVSIVSTWFEWSQFVILRSNPSIPKF